MSDRTGPLSGRLQPRHALYSRATCRIAGIWPGGHYPALQRRRAAGRLAELLQLLLLRFVLLEFLLDVILRPGLFHRAALLFPRVQAQTGECRLLTDLLRRGQLQQHALAVEIVGVGHRLQANFHVLPAKNFTYFIYEPLQPVIQVHHQMRPGGLKKT